MNPAIASAEIDSVVTELVVAWARTLLADRPVPRRNFRVVLGDVALARRVRAELDRVSSASGWFAVATSADEDAVRLRNQAPQRPAGVPERAPLVYLVFWCESEKGHAQNAQSLRDLTEVDVSDILGVLSVEHPIEKRMRERCQDAAKVWGDNKAGRACAAQLEAVWNILRCAVRTGRGGRDGTLPFVEDLNTFARWLRRAFVPDAEWGGTSAAERPALLVRRWGEALPELGLFRTESLASVLGVPVAADAKPTPKATTAAWPARVHELLAENQAAAVDFSALEDQIAGKLSVETRLAQEKRVRLALRDEPAARASLVKYCRGEASDALERVEWLFHEKPDDRRSASHGLKGLLIARSAGTTRSSPLDRASNDLRDLLALWSRDDSATQERIALFPEHMRQRAKADARFGTAAASAVRALAAREIPMLAGLEPATRDSLGQVIASPVFDAEALLRNASAWERLAADEDRSVEAPTLLLGLARLLFRVIADRQREQQPLSLGNGTLLLKVGESSTLELPIDGWRKDERSRITAWLRDRVLPDELEPQPDGFETDDDADEHQIVVAVALRKPDGTNERLGEVTVVWSPLHVSVTQASARIGAWSMAEPDRRPFRSQVLLQILKDHHQTTLGGQYSDVEPAFKSYLREVTAGPHAALTHVIAPLPVEARGWVDGWAKAFSWMDAPGALEADASQELTRQLQAALDAGEFAVAQDLNTRIKSLSQQPKPARPPPKDVRFLLQAGTAELRVGTGDELRRHVVLLPHHPLVLRLRALSEELLCESLRTMAQGWPERALGDLESALTSWGAPEPQHLYGWWDGEPLVFDEWLADFGIARFGPFGDPEGADPGRQGVREAARVLDRYARLFPAAGDRLALRVEADADGEWANRLVSLMGRHADLEQLNADIDVLGVRDLVQFTRESWRDAGRRPLLELHDDGTEPRVRLRANPTLPAPAHIGFVVGETVAALQPTIHTVAPPPARGGIWERSALFQDPYPELLTASFHVGDPLDSLCRNVALAVSYARSEQLQVHVERYSFDDTKVREPIQRLHAGAHWLALSSRRPLYRAVQAAGEDVATLLDFRTTWDAGRPLHVCVSVSTGELTRDLHRLAGLLKSLIGEDIPGLASSVISLARHFAPGFAINCAGAPSPAAVEGLLGLLLTAHRVRSTRPPATLVLALDQHQSLLARTKDQSRSDILTMSFRPDAAIDVRVAESKLTINEADAKSSVVTRALEQTRTTLERLNRLAVEHPLAASVRSQLRSALIEHLHLATSTREEELVARPFVDALGKPGTSIRLVEPSEVHVWSLASGTHSESATPSGASVFIYDRVTTLDLLRTLAGDRRQEGR